MIEMSSQFHVTAASHWEGSRIPFEQEAGLDSRAGLDVCGEQKVYHHVFHVPCIH